MGAIRRTRRTYTKVSMQLLCALMLLADVSAWYHNGGRDKLDFYMTRIGNLGEYLINFIFIALFANYIWQTVSGDDMLENVSPHEWRARTSGGAKRNRKNQRSANAQSKPKKPRSKKLDVIYAGVRAIRAGRALQYRRMPRAVRQERRSEPLLGIRRPCVVPVQARGEGHVHRGRL